MRTIETKMLEAVINKTNWQLDNTSVKYNAETDTSRVHLFNNHICSYHHRKDNAPRANKTVFTKYPTRTTVSRLRALGIDARVKNKQPTINGVAI